MAGGRETAAEPQDLARFFVDRANAGDAEGLAALYEPDAVLAFPPGREIVGREAIRAAYERLLASKPRFEVGEQLSTLRNGDLVLTSTRTPDGGARAEVARRQPDGTWLYVIDRPRF